jgi:crotonobetaine/carnitine-CoA ligase
MQSKTSTWTAPELDSVLAALRRAVDEKRDQAFLDFSGQSFTYGEIDGLSSQLANSLATLGVTGGDRVTTLLDNGVDPLICWLALNKLGAIWVPINSAYRGEFLRHQMADCGAKLMICERHYLDRVSAIAERLVELKLVLIHGPSGDTPACPISTAEFDGCRGSDDTPITREVSPSEIACLFYTSGTTGPSKGCVLTHNYLCNTSRMSLDLYPPLQNESAIWWTPLPMFHLAVFIAVIIPTLLRQGQASIGQRFSISNFWSEVEKRGADHVLLLGAMIPLVANAPDDEAMLRYRGRLKVIEGAPFSSEVRATWKRRFEVGEINDYTYSLTEGGKLATCRYDQPRPPEGSSGRIAEDFDVLILDDDDRPLPPGTPGEIAFRPRKPHIMYEGYWQRPADTLKVWRNLWMHTGDIGNIDENGYFYFVDRKKDYLRHRGENISSFEMEAIFAEHPDIRDVAVHAVPSELGEDEIKVTAVLKAGTSLTEESLCRWSVDRVPYFAVPRFIEFREVLPRNPVGRLLKFQLRAEGRTQNTWDRAKSDLKIQRR